MAPVASWHFLEGGCMLGCRRALLSLVFLAACGVPAVEAQIIWHERPALFVPLRPLAQKDLDRRESLKLYALGFLYVRDDRLLEAVETFEKAAKLDLDATEVLKTLIPLYVALDRGPDALAVTRKVLDLDPNDYEVWYMYARQLKSQGKTKDACAALERGLALPGLKEHPEVAQPMYLLLGLLHESNDELVAAADAFREAAKILDHPEALIEVAPLTREGLALRAAELYEKTGGIYLRAKQYEQAVAAYRQAQARYPDGAGRLNFNLALVLEKQDKLPQALTSVEAYLRLLPQGMEAYELKIKLLKALRSDAEVVPWLAQASKNDRFNVGLKLLLARSCAQARQTFEAEKIYTELAAQAPSAEVYRGLFRLYVDEPRLGAGRALTLLDKTIEEARNPPPPGPHPPSARAQAMVAALREDPTLATDLVRFAYLSRLPQGNAGLNGQTLFLLAALADRQRQLEEAEKFYRECLRRPAPDMEPLYYGGLLQVLWKAHKYQDLTVVCRQGLAQAQNTRTAVFRDYLARALARQGKTDEALAEVERGLVQAADPDRFAFRQLKVSVLTMAARFDRAEAECQAMLKDHHLPGEIQDVRALLSNVYSSARQFSKAEEQLGLVLKMDPNNATANNDLGYIWADQGKRLKEAEELIRKAIDLDRQQRQKAAAAYSNADNAAYIDSLGWVLFRRGQLNAARDELERAVTLPGGEDPTIYDHLGDVYYRLQQIDRARTAWRQALTLYERERVRTMDQKYKDLRRKYKLLDSARQP
jgi:tetratricopeptide (TPR) repeat protein